MKSILDLENRPPGSISFLVLVGILFSGCNNLSGSDSDKSNKRDFIDVSVKNVELSKLPASGATKNVTDANLDEVLGTFVSEAVEDPVLGFVFGFISSPDEPETYLEDDDDGEESGFEDLLGNLPENFQMNI